MCQTTCLQPSQRPARGLRAHLAELIARLPQAIGKLSLVPLAAVVLGAL